MLLLLTIVITGAVLAANLGLFGESDIVRNFANWGLVPVLGAIVTAYVAITRGFFAKVRRLRVSLGFGGKDPGEVELDPRGCRYQLLDEQGKDVGRGTVIPVTEGQGWECTLPPNAWEAYFIILTLHDSEGTTWRAGPFYTNRTSQTAEVMT